MVKMSATYSGQLHCELEHGPSGTRIETDAPKDNQGKGESFSPTDLVGAALSSCVLTTMALAARKDGIELDGIRADVVKEMIAQPSRRIGALTLKVTLPASISAAHREKLEAVARNCPVAKSLHPDLQAPMTFEYR